MKAISSYILTAYSLISSDSAQSNLSVGYKLENGNPIPSFDEDILIQLCSEAKLVFSKEKNVLSIEGDVIIVGDIHGSFHDLLRILNFIEKNDSKALFLGDFVDRGDFSLECITILFALKVQYPNKFFFIRGNHEFDMLCSQYGFKNEIINSKSLLPFQKVRKTVFENSQCYKYSEKLYKSFISAFSYLPIAAVLNETTFCIHGGLSPKLDHIDDIEKLIKRPIDDFTTNSLFSDLIWSDPSYGSSCLYDDNPRGLGHLYNNESVSTFLKNNSYLRMVRAHQCVMNGICSNAGDKCITVFSASSYGKVKKNSSAVLQLFQKEDNIKITTFPPIRRLNKSDAYYYKVQSLNNNKDSDFHSCFSLLHPKLLSCCSIKMFTNVNSNHKNILEKKSSQERFPNLPTSKFITNRRKSDVIHF